jgi:hypothetical protein
MTGTAGRATNLRPSPEGASGTLGGRSTGLSLTALVRAKLREPVAAGSPISKGEARAARVVELARAGDRASISRVRQRVGVDLTTTDLTDAELTALLVARMGLTTAPVGESTDECR